MQAIANPPSGHVSLLPSPWVVSHGECVPAGATVLDVASGGGRHARWFAARGCVVDAVDRDPQSPGEPVRFIQADIESGPWPWPASRRWDAVIVTNYLHRPLLPLLVGAIAPGGLLIYETFALGNEQFGKPSNPDFLLRPGELLDAVRGHLEVVAYAHGRVEIATAPGQAPRPAVIQRIAARRT